MLVYESSLYSYGYGGYDWDNMTSALQTSTGNQVTVVSNFENLSQMLLYDALWIDIQQKYDPIYGVYNLLSDTEVNNISDYIDTGRKVVMIGENRSWTPWNTQILNIVGGTFVDDTEDMGLVVTSSVYAHDLTYSAPTIFLNSAGFVSGGKALYDINFATLWGAQSNVLTILDVNVMSDEYWGVQHNGQFSLNVANWVADTTVVPEPISSTLFVIGAGILAGRRYLRRRNK